MTVLEVLPKDEYGRVIIPIAAIDGQGNEIEGIVDVAWLCNVDNPLAVHLSKAVPLSQADYQALLDASTPNWKLNWARFRQQGLI